MNLKALLFLLAITGSSKLLSLNTAADSGRKHPLSILCSLKPAIRFLGMRDSIGNFMYSKSQLEVRYAFKKHMIGLGINGFHRSSESKVNSTPTVTDRLQFSMNPYYGYMFSSSKRWKFFAGIGYINNYDDNLYTITSNIEKVEKRTTVIEEGSDIFLRINCRISKRLSVELETALYITRERAEYNETYSLSPGLTVYRNWAMNTQTYASPSNLLICYTF